MRRLHSQTAEDLVRDCLDCPLAEDLASLINEKITAIIVVHLQPGSTFQSLPTSVQVGFLAPPPNSRRCARSPTLRVEASKNPVRQRAVVRRLLRAASQAEVANNLQPTDRRARHGSVEAEEIDSQGDLAHFGGAPDAMGHDPLEHIGRTLLPVESGISVVE